MCSRRSHDFTSRCHTESAIINTNRNENFDLVGADVVDELLAGLPERFKEQFGMSKYAFQQLSRELQLYSGLTNRRDVTADEQLVTFLYIAWTGSSTRILQEHFQRSPSMMSG